MHDMQDSTMGSEEFDDRLFQGAPLLARVDNGDSFDLMLSSWLANQRSLRPAGSNELCIEALANPFVNSQGRLIPTTQPPNASSQYQDFQQYSRKGNQVILPESLSIRGQPGQSQHMTLQLKDLEAASLQNSQPPPQSEAPIMLETPALRFEDPGAFGSQQQNGRTSVSQISDGKPPYSQATALTAPNFTFSQSAGQHQNLQRRPSQQTDSIPTIHKQTGSGYASGGTNPNPEAIAQLRETNGINSRNSHETSSSQASHGLSHLHVKQDGQGFQKGQSGARHANGNLYSHISSFHPNGLRLPELPSPQDTLYTVEDAKQAWDSGAKKKSRPMSAESKEKERARNRRAQKRFREREKERQEERHTIMATLEAQLAQLKQEKDELARKNIELEEQALKNSQKAMNPGPTMHFDGSLYVETQKHEMSSEFPIALQQSQFLQGIDLKHVSFREYTKVYKKYVEALHLALMDTRLGKHEQLIHIIHDLCDLNLYLALHNPEFGKFISGRLDADGINSSHAPQSVWKRCLSGLMLSQQQRKAMLATRAEYLQKLKPLLQQREELHRLVSVCGPSSTISYTERRDNTTTMLDAVVKLKKNLYEEQGLLVQTLCATHQQFLAPEQTAMNVVLAYPYYPDLPMLVDLIASETPGEQTAAEILKVAALPDL